jgi:hypothetical protein
MTGLRSSTYAAMLAVFLCACSSGSETMKSSGIHTDDAQSVGKKLGIELPPATEVVGVETEAGIDDAIRAKLRIPASHSADFLRECGVKRFRQGGANLLGPDHGFWDPHGAKALRAGEVTLQSGRSLVIAVDESSDDVLVVYAMNYST